MEQFNPSPAVTDDSAWSIFLIFLRLGLTSFGGPIAHLAFFRNEFVTHRQWLAERSYVDLVTLCQLMPGPTSSQVGIGLGLSRGGIKGAVAAWTGFTLPSAIIMVLFAQGLVRWGTLLPNGVLHGLKVVAVAVVAQAAWGMIQALCTDFVRLAIAGFGACVALLVPETLGQIMVISAAALIGVVLLKSDQPSGNDSLSIPISKKMGATILAIFIGLLALLPVLAEVLHSQTLAVVSVFVRTGSLVFGGGHVVLPLLQAATVPTGWVAQETFLTGYGLAQALPGPLFTFAAFLGASMNVPPSGWPGAMLCLCAIFAPSFLLVLGVLPFWDSIRHSRRLQAGLAGTAVGVVGLLMAALYDPVWTTAIHNPQDIGLALMAFAALVHWKTPPWLVVAGTALIAGLVSNLP